MRLRLKTKFTLTTALLVFTVVALVSVVSVAALVRQTFRNLDDRAHYVAQLILDQAQRSLEDAAARGLTPATDSDADLETYVRDVLQKDSSMSAALQAPMVLPTIYEVSIVDHDSVALVSSDEKLEGHMRLPRARLETLTQFDFIEQLRVLYGPPRVYEVTLPL